MIEKYGIEKGTEKYYLANKNRAITLNNLINKHGKTTGQKFYEEYVKKRDNYFNLYS
jgi:hypothetical protein